MLTVDQLQPKINDVNDLINNGEFVGYQLGSFVRGFLTNNSILESASLKSYKTVDQIHEALSKGSKNGGVGAIVDELQASSFQSLRQAYPKGSPLVYDVSHEILKLKEDRDLMVRMTRKWLGDAKECPSADGALSTSQRLNIDSFKGLFVIAGVSSTLALAIFLSLFLYENRCLLESTASSKEKLLGLAMNFMRAKDESLSPKETRSPDRGVGVVSAAAASPAMSVPCEQEEEGMFSQL